MPFARHPAKAVRTTLLAWFLLGAVTSCSPKKMDLDSLPDPPEVIPVSKGAYKHVVIVGCDGAGAFFQFTDTPRIDDIFAGGVLSYRWKAVYPTISAQNWGAILHGVEPELHRLTNSIVVSRHYPQDSMFPSLFKEVRKAMPTAKLASFCNWDAVNYGIIETGLGVTEGTGSDAEVTRQVVAYLEDNKPTLLFVHFDSPDAAGHSFGYGSDIHLTTISVLDALIGRIHDSVRKIGILDDTLFIVCTDHGGTPQGSHGGDTDEELYVFIGIAGKTVASKTLDADADNRDIAAIAAYALGVDIPDTWTAHIPGGVFKGIEATRRNHVELPISPNRHHQTEPTPSLETFRKHFEDRDVTAYLPFDSGTTDALGQTETSQDGKIYFYDGYFGKGAAFDDGYVTLKDMSFGSGSFSVCFWMKTSGLESGDPALISNKDWTSGLNDGWVLSLRQEDVKFNAAVQRTDTRMDLVAPLPHDYDTGWMHVALVVDRASNVVDIYYDFTLEGEISIPQALRGESFDAMALRIGQDGTGKYPNHLPAQLDEMVIVAEALSQTDIESLEQYYK